MLQFSHRHVFSLLIQVGYLARTNCTNSYMYDIHHVYIMNRPVPQLNWKMLKSLKVRKDLYLSFCFYHTANL